MLNPILNAYIIELNPVDKSKTTTFRSFCMKKYTSLEVIDDDKEVFKFLFEELLKDLSGDKLMKNKRSQKVFGIEPAEYIENKSIKSHSDSHIIDGIIDGGKYGIQRQVVDIDDNKNRGKLNTKNAILDKYYFLLHIPLNSSKGVLLVQSYTEETIQLPLKDFFKEFFSCEKQYYNLIYKNYIPAKIIEKYLKSAEVTMFKYHKIMNLDNSMRKTINAEIDEFEVTIQIKPKLSNKTKITPTPENLLGIVNSFKEKVFDNKKLGETPTVFIKNQDGNAHFDIDEEISKIEPTLYLKNEGVEIDQNTGMPNFEQIRKVCHRVLKEICNEIEDNNNIDEL